MGTSGFKTEGGGATNAVGGGGGNGGGGVGIGGGGGAGGGATNATAANLSVELCLVCGDRASGRHYGAISCEGCKGFFKRSIRKQLGYQCRGAMNCEVTKHHRNRCQFCRLQKCLASGMRSDSVQHERKPIVDKKEFLNSSNTNTGSALNVTAPTHVGLKSSSPGIYTARGKQNLYQHNLNNNTGNTNASTSAAAAAFSLENNITAAGVLPIGLNLAELTQTWMLATQQQQQQQQQQQLSSQSQSAKSLCFSPELPKTGDEDDEDSMDNSSTMCLQNLSTTASNNNSQNLNFNMDMLPHPATAVGLLQTSMDKRVIDKALQLLPRVQNELDRLMLLGGGNNAGAGGNGGTGSNVLNVKNEVDEEMDEGSAVEDDVDLDNNPVEQKEFVVNECVFENELISAAHAPFNLQVPTLATPFLALHYVCETGSRIIFLSVYWLRKVPTFELLDESSQIKLLRAAWPSLLAIAVAQVRTLSVNTIISTLSSYVRQQAVNGIDKVEPQKIRKLSEQTANLHNFVQEMRKLELDDMEYAFLRIAAVFNPYAVRRKERNVRDYVRRVQLYALSQLRKHIAGNMQYDEQWLEERFNTLVMNLMPLGALESDIIEELFFSELLGQVQIDNMMPYIITLSANSGL